MSVQPLTPYQPTTNVLVALRNAPTIPETPTTPSVSATAPSQVVSEFNAVKQLPSYTVTALVSQQAVNASNLSDSEKVQHGILNGTAGVTYKQLDLPGQSIKPGAADFIQNLQQTVPNLPLNLAASGVLLTGFGGITSTENLLNNTDAQVSAITNSIQNATTNLTNNGLLTGKENPTQVAGVVMAAATLGVNTITDALKDPLSIAGKIGGDGNPIGNAIASGTFAAGLADKVSTGLSSLSSSLTGVVSGALGSMSSGITKFLEKTTSGIEALVNGISGQLQNAFNLAEKSFGELKAGEENVLGGVEESPQAEPSDILKAINENNKNLDDLLFATQELVTARKAYYSDPSEANLAALKAAEGKRVSIEQKLAQSTQKIATGTGVQVPNSSNITGGISTQTLTEIATSAASGLLNLPKTQNTGINALPGGVGAFASQIGGAATNILGTLKGAASSITSAVPAALKKLSNPSQLVGDLISNLKSSISEIASNLTGGVEKLQDNINNIAGSASGAVNALASNAVSAASGIVSNITSSLSALGNAPGQIKSAILAVNTFKDTKKTMTATLSSLMDPKVPKTVFDEIIPQVKVDEYQAAQVTAQLNLEELFAQRETKSYKLSAIIDKYIDNPQPALITEIDNLKNEIATLDKNIDLAQDNYDKLVNGQ